MRSLLFYTDRLSSFDFDSFNSILLMEENLFGKGRGSIGDCDKREKILNHLPWNSFLAALTFVTMFATWPSTEANKNKPKKSSTVM